MMTSILVWPNRDRPQIEVEKKNKTSGNPTHSSGNMNVNIRDPSSQCPPHPVRMKRAKQIVNGKRKGEKEKVALLGNNCEDFGFGPIIQSTVYKCPDTRATGRLRMLSNTISISHRR